MLKNANGGLTVLVCGLIALVIATSVLLGWAFDLPMLVRVQPFWVPMVLNTAICCWLSGLSLVFSHLFKDGGADSAQKVFGTIVLIIASLVMIEIVFEINLHIDWPDLHRPLQPEYANPGRMAPNTALALILFSLGLLAKSFNWAKENKQNGWIKILASGVFILGLLGIFGYWLKLEYLYNWTGVVRMSMPTAVCVIILGLGLFNLSTENEADETQADDVDVTRIYRASAFVISFICLAAGVAGFSVLAQRNDEVIGNNLLQIAKDRSFFFNVAITSRLDRSKVASKNPDFVPLLKELSKNPTNPGVQQDLAKLSHSLVENGFYSIAFEDTNGHVWQAAGPALKADRFAIPLQGEYENSLLWNSGYVLYSRVPIRDAQDKTLGYMLTEQPLKALSELREQALSWGKTSDMVVCGLADEAMNCFPSRIQDRPFKVEKYYKGQRLPMSYALDRHETGVKIALDYRGHRVMAAYVPIAETGLGMVIKFDVAELYEPIKEQLQKASALVVGLLAFGLWLIRKRLLPLVKNIHDARTQAESDKARFIAAAEGGFDSFYIFDALRDAQNEIIDFRCTFINTRGSQLISRKPGEFVGKLLCETLPLNRGAMYFDRFKSVIESGHPAYDELQMDDTQIDALWIARQIVKLGDGIAVTVRDITEQKRTEEYMRHVAMHDVLTGLPNRALFDDRAQVALQHAKRDKQMMAIVLLDLDHFKRVNDTYGHQVGDQLLKHLADCLSKNIRPSDTAARLGGDEFALVLPNISHPDGSVTVLNKILKALQLPIMVNGRELHASVSIGICAYPADGLDMITLMRHADVAMYAAKAAGRNNFKIYDSEME